MVIRVLNELMRRDVFLDKMDGEIIYVSRGKLIVSVNKMCIDDLAEMIDVISYGTVEYTFGQFISDRCQAMFEEI